jgi:sortase (surface protein transpeptidase)
MITRVGRDKRSSRQWMWWVIAGAALVVAVGSFVGMLPTKEPNTVVISQAPKGTSTTSTPTLALARRSSPVRLTIPAIGVATTVGTLGLQANGQVMVPSSTHTVGWYVDGPAPGQMGSAVILGHVDSYQGPGVFFALKTLKPGSAITVTLRDGVVTHFVVTRVVQYSKTSFPDQLVYGSRRPQTLNLVTCGGTFDHTTGHYEANVVVFSRLVSVASAKRAASSPTT